MKTFDVTHWCDPEHECKCADHRACMCDNVWMFFPRHTVIRSKSAERAILRVVAMVRHTLRAHALSTKAREVQPEQFQAKEVTK